MEFSLTKHDLPWSWSVVGCILFMKKIENVLDVLKAIASPTIIQTVMVENIVYWVILFVLIVNLAQFPPFNNFFVQFAFKLLFETI